MQQRSQYVIERMAAISQARSEARRREVAPVFRLADLLKAASGAAVVLVGLEFLKVVFG
jgi:hypothetical protein